MSGERRATALAPRRLAAQAEIAEHESRHPETVIGCRECAFRSAARGETLADPERFAPDAEGLVPFVPPVEHRIIESFIEDTAQTVRCACGNSAMFGRERDYLGLVKRARALSEFVCTGKVITLRASLIREV